MNNGIQTMGYIQGYIQNEQWDAFRMNNGMHGDAFRMNNGMHLE